MAACSQMLNVDTERELAVNVRLIKHHFSWLLEHLKPQELGPLLGQTLGVSCCAEYNNNHVDEHSRNNQLLLTLLRKPNGFVTLLGAMSLIPEYTQAVSFLSVDYMRLKYGCMNTNNSRDTTTGEEEHKVAEDEEEDGDEQPGDAFTQVTDAPCGDVIESASGLSQLTNESPDLYLNTAPAVSCEPMTQNSIVCAKSIYRSGLELDGNMADVSSSDEEEMKLEAHTILPDDTSTLQVDICVKNMLFGCVNEGQLVVLFNELSALVNNGLSKDFERESSALHQQYPDDANLKSMLHYLTASSLLTHNKHEATLIVIQRAKTFIKENHENFNKHRALVDILGSECWLYLQQNEFSRALSSVEAGMRIITKFPKNCIGKGPAWIFINYAKVILAPLSVKNQNFCYVRQQAIDALTQAVVHFEQDTSQERDFGICFSKLLLAMVLLSCGDQMQWVSYIPKHCEVDKALSLIWEVETGAYVVHNVPHVHLNLYKGDFFVRQGFNMKQKALKSYVTARNSAQEFRLELLQFRAENKIAFVQRNLLNLETSALYSVSGSGTLFYDNQVEKSGTVVQITAARRLLVIFTEVVRLFVLVLLGYRLHEYVS